MDITEIDSNMKYFAYNGVTLNIAERQDFVTFCHLNFLFLKLIKYRSELELALLKIENESLHDEILFWGKINGKPLIEPFYDNFSSIITIFLNNAIITIYRYCEGLLHCSWPYFQW